MFLAMYSKEESTCGAQLETSQGKITNSHYLRVTLKSVTPFNTFLVKALSATTSSKEGISLSKESIIFSFILIIFISIVFLLYQKPAFGLRALDQKLPKIVSDGVPTKL